MGRKQQRGRGGGGDGSSISGTAGGYHTVCTDTSADLLRWTIDSCPSRSGGSHVDGENDDWWYQLGSYGPAAASASYHAVRLPVDHLQQSRQITHQP